VCLIPVSWRARPGTLHIPGCPPRASLIHVFLLREYVLKVEESVCLFAWPDGCAARVSRIIQHVALSLPNAPGSPRQYCVFEGSDPPPSKNPNGYRIVSRSPDARVRQESGRPSKGRYGVWRSRPSFQLLFHAGERPRRISLVYVLRRRVLRRVKQALRTADLHEGRRGHRLWASPQRQKVASHDRWTR
jgi:hypothetical protein